jgi:hypothetical protein
MLNYNMSVMEYKQLIQNDWFALKEYKSEFYYEFEQLGSYGKDLVFMFEQLASRYNRVPSQAEYIKEGFERAKEFFTDPKKVKQGGRWFVIGKDDYGNNEFAFFMWDEDKKLQEAVKTRLARSYSSHLVEYSTILTIKELFPELHVGANEYLDLVAGIDIVLGNKAENKMLYIHITSESSYSDYWMKRKEKKKGVGIDKTGKMHFYTRNFKKGHLQITFSYEESASTDIFNGIPFIKEEHLKNIIEKSFEKAPYLDSFKKKEQLKKLHDWLKGNGINKNGISKLWIK